MLIGAASGLAGALAAVLVLWGAWMLHVLGLLLTRATPLLGALAVVVLGVLGGVAFGALYPWRGTNGRPGGQARGGPGGGEGPSEPQPSPGVGPGLRAARVPRALSPWALALSGLLLGAGMWLVGPLVLVPRVLGFPAFPAAPTDQIASLGAFLAYGLVTAFAFGAGVLSSRAAAAQRTASLLAVAALGCLLASAGSTFFLLRGARATDPAALDLPPGYRAEVVAKGLTFPSSLEVAPDGTIYVAESGFVYGPKTTVARVLAISPQGSVAEVARGFEGPINGLALRGGRLYVSHRAKITVLDLAEKAGGAAPSVSARRDLVSGLPSLGDHHNNDLKFGPDGMLYVGQGTATNAGVVGSDNFVYAWAARYPGFHDVPSRDWTLVGQSYPDLDLRTPDPADRVETGAFAPFGTRRQQRHP
ncbi:MAG: hypothetical protein K6T75_00440 [Acetobacteraceae bacterium]|nr:hypothetical protein [Acetobacteraceae bacterium]